MGTRQHADRQPVTDDVTPIGPVGQKTRLACGHKGVYPGFAAWRMEGIRCPTCDVVEWPRIY